MIFELIKGVKVRILSSLLYLKTPIFEEKSVTDLPLIAGQVAKSGKSAMKNLKDTQLFVILQFLKMNYKNLITMKKILLSLLCLTLFSGIFAQSFSITDTNGVVLNPGATIQFLGDPADEVIKAVIYLKNNSDAAKDVKVKKVINQGDTLPGTNNTFCFGGLCFPPTTYLSPSYSMGPGEVYKGFYGDYNPQTVPGISRIMYVFFDVNNTNDSVAVTVEYNASPASVNDDLAALVKFSDAYPNPATDVVSVEYMIPGTVKKASIAITNMLGSKIREVNLEDLSGKSRIPVSDLMNGIYFYSLVADHQLVLTKKFVVKR
jgi:hypothetical protein